MSEESTESAGDEQLAFPSTDDPARSATVAGYLSAPLFCLAVLANIVEFHGPTLDEALLLGAMLGVAAALAVHAIRRGARGNALSLAQLTALLSLLVVALVLWQILSDPGRIVRGWSYYLEHR
jgi:hypothetical protein